MSRGPYPILLLLAMSLPGAARAIGLGEIHVDSALNEPLQAQIDIVGATRDDLAVLTAKIANREVFQRYGADRPSFLNTATFKVGLNAQGHPVLNVRSAEAFSDPVVSFLVDLHYGNGELIREYSLLLDPPGLIQARADAMAAAASQAGEAPAPAASGSVTAAHTAASTTDTTARVTSKRRSASASGPAAASTSATATASSRARVPAPAVDTLSAGQHRVTAHDTLRSIARRAGARTEPQAQRLMIALFRANPTAFDGNINLLHLDAVLNMPSADAVAAIDPSEARKEVRAQMTAWRLEGRPSTARRAAAAAAVTAPVAEVAHRVAPATPGTAAAPTAEPTADALKSRVASLELALDSMRQQLTQLTGHSAAAPIAPVPVATAPAAAPATATAPATAPATATAPAVATATAAPPVAAAPRNSVPQVQVMRDVPPAATAPAAAPAPTAASGSHTALFAGLAGSLAVLLGGFAFMRRRALRGKSNLAAGVDAVAIDPVLMPGTAAAAVKAEPAVKAKPPQSQRITVREIPDPPIVSEIKQRELNDESDPNLFIDTEALERSYLDSLGIDTHGVAEELSPEMADTTQELADESRLEATTALLDEDTAKLHNSALQNSAPQNSGSFTVISREVTGSREATGLDTVAIDTSDLEAELREADPNTVILDNLQSHAEAFDEAQAPAQAEHELDSDDDEDTLSQPPPPSYPLPPRVSLTGSNPIAIDATPPGATVLDYNLLDLDATAQHVQMPSELNDHVVVSERRTNIVDVLKQAIDRDPHRRDLRMKLLETYYSAASMNQRAFLEVVRKLARDRDFLSGDDWKKVMMMGRDIAAEDILFADPVKDDDLADCA
jgi:FimV-like protein